MDDTDPRPNAARRRTGALMTFLATGFGVGLTRCAPGTFGALWGLPLAWACAWLPPVVQAAAIVGLFLASVPVCTAAARYLGGKDPGAIVLDEIASLPVVFFMVPLNDWSWKLAVAGFALHRLFDITKPPPARRLERLPEGLGIVADDFAAAVYAGLSLHLARWSGIIE